MPFKKHPSDYRDDLMEELKRYKDGSFIVEGKRDVTALAMFGILDVRYLKGMGLHEFCDELDRTKTYIILMDFDPTGERLAKKLEEYMRESGIKVDRNARARLRKVFIENNLNTIQGVRNIK